MFKLTFVIELFPLFFLLGFKLAQSLLYFALLVHIRFLEYRQYFFLSWACSIFKVGFEILINRRLLLRYIKALRERWLIWLIFIWFFLPLGLRSSALSNPYDITIFSILEKVLILLLQLY